MICVESGREGKEKIKREPKILHLYFILIIEIMREFSSEKISHKYYLTHFCHILSKLGSGTIYDFNKFRTKVVAHCPCQILFNSTKIPFFCGFQLIFSSPRPSCCILRIGTISLLTDPNRICCFSILVTPCNTKANILLSLCLYVYHTPSVKESFCAVGHIEVP